MLGRRARREPPDDRPAVNPPAGRAIRAERDALLADTGLGGLAFCHAYAHRADTWLTGLLDEA
ncbi:MAG: hypothetical protein M3357_05085, partial [Actinomycetota bacterium]|nr:hypothetical protein [Actinomycetota bacterium]